MSTCKTKLCGCTAPCGCGDNVLAQNCPASTYPVCENPEKCAEITDSECVVYQGDTIVNIDVPNGMRVSDWIQRMIGVVTNPGCNYPDSPCQSVIGFYSKVITSTTASFKWIAAEGSPSYRVEYRVPTAVSWTQNPTVTTTFDKIGDLLPNTTYYVRVTTLCGDSSCYSVTLQFKTKTS